MRRVFTWSGAVLLGCAAQAGDAPPPEIMTRIEAAAELVRAHRGDFEIPKVRLGTSEMMVALARSEFEERLDEPSRAYMDCTLVAWGMVEPGTSFLDVVAPYFTDAGGVYVSHADEIVVNTDEKMHDALDLILQHELVHALQDQVSPALDLDPNSMINDQADVVRLLAEGDATATTMVIAMGDAGLDADPVGLELAAPRHPHDTLLETYLHDTLLQPYGQGARVVQRIVKEGGWSRVNELLRDLPLSSEQLLVPARAGERPVYGHLDVSAALGAEWRTFPADTIGLFTLDAVVWSWLDPNRTDRVVHGWAGDRLQCAMHESGRAGFVWRTAWDSVGHAEAFEAHAGQWRIADAPVVVERRADEVLLVSGLPEEARTELVASAWRRPMRPVRSVKKLARFAR